MTGSKKGFTSIVMLTYNAFPYTQKCIHSIQRHTPEDFEFVFIDNGSTDGTVQYLQTIPQATLSWELI